MTAKRKWLIGLTGGLLSLLLFGFLIFAAVIMRDPKPSEVKADGIVVLTGGGQRIREAGKLLGAGRAKRLLVTGINQRTKPHQILKLSGLEKALFECCVDLGYEALDTVGNAAETPRLGAGKEVYDVDCRHFQLSHAAQPCRVVAQITWCDAYSRTP